MRLLVGAWLFAACSTSDPESAVRVVTDAAADAPVAPAPLDARLIVDASHVEGEVSPLLYGQFAEFMFEGVKGGLHAELLRDRGFEERPNAIGLPRYWERYPDDRNDDYALTFGWDSATRNGPT